MRRMHVRISERYLELRYSLDACHVNTMPPLLPTDPFRVVCADARWEVAVNLCHADDKIRSQGLSKFNIS